MSRKEIQGIHRFHMTFPKDMFEKLEVIGAQSVGDANGIIRDGLKFNGIIRDALKFRGRLLRELELFSPNVCIGTSNIDIRLALEDYKSTDTRRKNVAISDYELQVVVANSARLNQGRTQYIRESTALWLKMLEETSKQGFVQNFSGIACEVNGRPMLLINA